MVVVRNVIGGLMVLLGGVWFLQGINVLPGSFMTGSNFWAVAGAVTLLVGLLVLTRFRAGPPRR
jgi:hypothetical protein